MKKIIAIIKIIVFLALTVALFGCVTKHYSDKAFNELKATEKPEVLTEIDRLSMADFSHQNSKLVMQALKNNRESELAELLISKDGLNSVLKYVNWSKADIKNVVSMGSGSFMTKPDRDGKMDIGERFFINIDGKKYVLYIETLTSRLGRDNDGVSAIGVTSFDHFDSMDWMWNGEKDSQSALAGSLYWK